MKITITGSLGNISSKLIEMLIARGHQLTVISSNPDKAAAIAALGAMPAIGSVEDPAFLNKAFSGSSAAYTMIPPNYKSPHLLAYIRTVGENYARVIKAAGIQWVVNLSSIGAHKADGAGPTGANYYVEKQLDALEGVQVLHLRPGMFYTNFWGSAETILQQNILGNNFNDAVSMALTHPHDIAAVAAEALHSLSFSGSSYRYVVSDEKTGREIAGLLGQALGQPDLRWIEFSDQGLLQGLLKSGMSEQMARIYILEIGHALQNGSLLEDYRLHKSNSLGKTSFYEFAKEFANALQHAQ